MVPFRTIRARALFVGAWVFYFTAVVLVAHGIIDSYRCVPDVHIIVIASKSEAKTKERVSDADVLLFVAMMFIAVAMMMVAASIDTPHVHVIASSAIETATVDDWFSVDSKPMVFTRRTIDKLLEPYNFAQACEHQPVVRQCLICIEELSVHDKALVRIKRCACSDARPAMHRHCITSWLCSCSSPPTCPLCRTAAL